MTAPETDIDARCTATMRPRSSPGRACASANVRAWLSPEDLAQEVWMRALKAAPTRDLAANVRA